MYKQSLVNMQYLKDNSGFSAEFLAEIEANITPTKAIYDDAVAKLAGVVDVMTALSTKLDTVCGLKIKFQMPERPAEQAPATPRPNVNNGLAQRYHSDDNKIVLLTYENGKTFILNFNSFDITTKIGNVIYTVSAYDYVVIK